MVCLAFAESIQLVPDGTLFLHIAIILAMVFVLNRVLFRPVNRMLEEREKSTHGRSGEAHAIMERVEESLRRSEQTLREARAEGYRLLEQQLAETAGERQRKIGLVRVEIEEQLEAERMTIQAQAQEARAALSSEAERVATAVKAQILGR